MPSFNDHELKDAELNYMNNSYIDENEDEELSRKCKSEKFEYLDWVFAGTLFIIGSFSASLFVVIIYKLVKILCN